MKNARVTTQKEVWVFSCISSITLNPFFQEGDVAVPGQPACLARLMASMCSPQSRAAVRNE